jgi:hypothetical protein
MKAKYFRLGKVILLCIPFSLCASSENGHSSAIIVKAASLQELPKLGAKAIAELAAEQKVGILQREGGWYQIAVDEALNGWVKLLSVRFEKSAYRPGNMGVSALWNVVKSGHSDVTATTGVRGLGEEDIKKASANIEALKIMQDYEVNLQDAQKFAQSGKLNARKLAYLESIK